MIRNLTPHPITVAGVTIEPDGCLPRVSEQTREVGRLVDYGEGAWTMQWDMRTDLDGDGCSDPQPLPSEARPVIPVTELTLGDVVDLPEPRRGVWLVVSRMVAEAARDRHDLLIPGRQIRDEQGRVIGAESLSRLPRE